MPVFSVHVIAVYNGVPGSRAWETANQAEEWARAQGVHELAIGEPGCSVDHSVVPVTFRVKLTCGSKEEIPVRVREWARQHPILIRSIGEVSTEPAAI